VDQPPSHIRNYSQAADFHITMFEKLESFFILLYYKFLIELKFIKNYETK